MACSMFRFSFSAFSKCEDAGSQQRALRDGSGMWDSCVWARCVPDLDVSHMPAYQFACWQVFDDPKLILGIAHDAARFGFPQEETMLYAFTNGIVGAWGFPMVPYIHIFAN